MSLISIAQRETFHIFLVQFANKGYGADFLTPESYMEFELMEMVRFVRTFL